MGDCPETRRSQSTRRGGVVRDDPGEVGIVSSWRMISKAGVFFAKLRESKGDIFESYSEVDLRMDAKPRGVGVRREDTSLALARVSG